MAVCSARVIALFSWVRNSTCYEKRPAAREGTVNNFDLSQILHFFCIYCCISLTITIKITCGGTEMYGCYTISLSYKDLCLVVQGGNDYGLAYRSGFVCFFYYFFFSTIFGFVFLFFNNQYLYLLLECITFVICTSECNFSIQCLKFLAQVAIKLISDNKIN